MSPKSHTQYTLKKVLKLSPHCAKIYETGSHADLQSKLTLIYIISVVRNNTTGALGRAYV